MLNKIFTDSFYEKLYAIAITYSFYVCILTICLAYIYAMNSNSYIRTACFIITTVVCQLILYSHINTLSIPQIIGYNILLIGALYTSVYIVKFGSYLFESETLNKKTCSTNHQTNHCTECHPENIMDGNVSDNYPLTQITYYKTKTGARIHSSFCCKHTQGHECIPINITFNVLPMINKKTFCKECTYNEPYCLFKTDRENMFHEKLNCKHIKKLDNISEITVDDSLFYVLCNCNCVCKTCSQMPPSF